MKRLAALLCALLLVSCTAAPEQDVSAPAARPDIEPPARQSMIFLVDSGADAAYGEAAQLFADTVSSLTDGMFTVEVRRSVSAVADYHKGEGDLVFVDSRRDSGFSSDFAVLSEPLRYTDYDQFTMALNAQSLLGFLNDGLEDNGRNTTLLAAFYLGADYFVTARPLSRGGLAATQPEETEEDVDDDSEEGDEERPVAALRSGSVMAPFVAGMGLEPVIEPSLSTRLYDLVDGSIVVAEFTLEELVRIDWQDSDLNLILSDHNMTPAWLAVSSERWAHLPEQYQAVVQETVAYLFPVVDGEFRARQDTQVALMREGGVTVDSGFPALRTAAKAVYAAEDPRGFRESYLLKLIDSMQ